MDLSWFILVGLALLVWRSFIPSYFSEKGKNLATKEDIATITDEIERIKSEHAKRITELQHQHTVLIEQSRSQHQLRMAAIERRLEVHQEAYTRWRILLNKVFADDIVVYVRQCQDWWERNCLYLSAEAREAFQQAYFSAAHHNEMVKDRIAAETITENMNRIKMAGPLIVSGAALPSLGDVETSDVSAEKQA